MSQLLRADWLRFRRRKDLWIIAIAVLVVGGLAFIAGYRSDVVDPTWPDAAQIRQETIDFNVGFFEGTPAEIEAQVNQMVADQLVQYAQYAAEWEVSQAINLQKYDIVQAPFTVINAGILPMLALVLMASLAIGDEFRFGTIRTSLLAASSRRRFLAARFTTVLAMVVGLFVAQILLGLILGLGLRLTGSEVAASTTAIDPVSAAAWIGALVLATMVLISLGTALTVLLRSGAMPLLLIILFGVIELFVSALPIFQAPELLSGVPQGFIGTSIRTLTARLGLDTHAVALGAVEVPAMAIALPMIAVAAILAAWGTLFVVLADRRFRTMDVTE